MSQYAGSTPVQSPSLQSISARPPNGPRFTSGDIIAERYRISGLLGAGGMGEVYRADDLKLHQAVALKFLPRSLESDGGALSRLYVEVRVARQITHPNVCRVFDVGEFAGQHFISMEYVDGEDLASLLRRIGRLPSDKAIEIARQLSSGVAAAHEAGVVHRDLKPANIMIDGRGRARITDFGLAGLASDLIHDDLRAGTPAYMAPEQIAGTGVTERSDIYSMGLVLYELFSGKRAFQGPSIEELLEQQTHKTPDPLGSMVKDIDPKIEKLIFQCIEKDPSKRPASAVQVWAALPGSDPLAAALAAGETPSPEMVAGAHVEGALNFRTALTLLASALAGMIAVALLANKTALQGIAPVEKSPEVLADRAQTMIRSLGYGGVPAEAVSGLVPNTRYIQNIEAADHSPGRWNKLKSGRPPAIEFWYRQANQRFAPSDEWNVSQDDPALTEPGMISAELDTSGRLLGFNAVPPEPDTRKPVSQDFDWAVAFTLAGLDLSEFKPSAPIWPPPVYSDARAAWDGVLPDDPGTPIHIEASAYRGGLAHFEISEPWDREPRGARARPPENALQALLFTLVTVSFIASGLLARRNLRIGRGDTRGARRLSVFVLVVYLLAWFLNSNHLPLSLQLSGYAPVIWMIPTGRALFSAVTIWMAYVALEPYLRQRWPHRIISWSRLLAGRFRDPLVGRDILIGAVSGTALLLIPSLRLLVPASAGFPAPHPSISRLQPLLGFRQALGLLLEVQLSAVTLGLGCMFLLLLFFMALRKERAAAALLAVVVGVLNVLRNFGPHPNANWIFGAATAALMLFVLLRFGLLAFVTLEFFDQIQSYFPLTLDVSSWSIGNTEIALVILSLAVMYGFFTALAGRPIALPRPAKSTA